jgi:hypothetical protein
LCLLSLQSEVPESTQEGYFEGFTVAAPSVEPAYFPSSYIEFSLVCKPQKYFYDIYFCVVWYLTDRTTINMVAVKIVWPWPSGRS